MQHTVVHDEIYFCPDKFSMVLEHPGQTDENCCRVYGNSGYKFSRCVADKVTKEDGDRIASCLGFCQGVPTEVLAEVHQRIGLKELIELWRNPAVVWNEPGE